MAGPMNIDQEDVPHESSRSPTWDDLNRTVQSYSVTSRLSYNLKRKDAHRAVYVSRSCFRSWALKATINDEGIIVIRELKDIHNCLDAGTVKRSFASQKSWITEAVPLYLVVTKRAIPRSIIECIARNVHKTIDFSWPCVQRTAFAEESRSSLARISKIASI